MILTGCTILAGDLTGAPETASWVRIDNGVIAASGSGTVPRQLVTGDQVVTLDGGYLVPGFIDIHCHGGDLGDFASGEAGQLRRAAEFHRRHGTTSMLASLVAGSVDALTSQLAAIADLVTAGGTPIIGSHLEGPFLSRSRCGAQNPECLIDPDPGAFAQWLRAADDSCRMITLAPELPGALDIIDAALAAGVVPAVGHTDATYEQARAAFDRGAQVATHLFNAMGPVHHRAPGAALAALQSGAGCEIINDGVHVHPAMLRLVTDRDPAQLILITDAISAAGVGNGDYHLGGRPVRVADGQARVGGTGALAGSVLTMDAAVRRAVQTVGLPLATAVAAATANPARVLGLDHDRGRIEAGLKADLVHLNAELRPVRVMSDGRWC